MSEAAYHSYNDPSTPAAQTYTHTTWREQEPLPGSTRDACQEKRARVENEKVRGVLREIVQHDIVRTIYGLPILIGCLRISSRKWGV